MSNISDRLVDLRAYKFSGQVVEAEFFAVPVFQRDPNMSAADAVISELEACSDPSAKADAGMARALFVLANRTDTTLL